MTSRENQGNQIIPAATRLVIAGRAENRNTRNVNLPRGSEFTKNEIYFAIQTFSGSVKKRSTPRASVAILDYFDRTFRERLQESAPVRLVHDPIVENDDDAVIAFRSDQTSNALSKF